MGESVVDCPSQCLRIHVSQHQNFPGVSMLCDARKGLGFVELGSELYTFLHLFDAFSCSKFPGRAGLFGGCFVVHCDSLRLVHLPFAEDIRQSNLTARSLQYGLEKRSLSEVLSVSQGDVRDEDASEKAFTRTRCSDREARSQ